MQVPDQAYNNLQQTAVLNQNRDALIRHTTETTKTGIQ